MGILLGLSACTVKVFPLIKIKSANPIIDRQELCFERVSTINYSLADEIANPDETTPSADSFIVKGFKLDICYQYAFNYAREQNIYESAKGLEMRYGMQRFGDDEEKVVLLFPLKWSGERFELNDDDQIVMMRLKANFDDPCPYDCDYVNPNPDQTAPIPPGF